VVTTVKIAGSALALLLSGVVGYKLNSRPPQVVTRYQDRIVEKVVVKDVVKDIVKTETRPDGTKIVTVEKTDSKIRVDETVKIRKESAPSKPLLPQYSVGVNVQPKHLYPFEGVYGAELGVRIGNSPIWGTVEIRSNKDWSLGARWEF